jgi:membrane associated rhomboid family serine protease
MLTLFFLGKAISMRCGSKYVWLLYLGGGLTGSVFMNIFMPHNSIVMPQVGADASISAIISFYGVFNLQSQFILFFFPIRVWVLLAMMGAYSLLADPSKKNFGGLIFGALMYRLFKMKMI